MSAWRSFVEELAQRVERAIDDVRDRLRESADHLDFRPAPEAWSNLEIAEHVTWVNHYLSILVDKIAEKSRARTAHGALPGDSPSGIAHLEKLAAREFTWPAPEHMLPTRNTPADQIDARLEQQLEHCTALLAAMPDGEGSLHRIRMSVVGDDDRLDLYQFACVIALHAERHARAMRRNSAAIAARENHSR